MAVAMDTPAIVPAAAAPAAAAPAPAPAAPAPAPAAPVPADPDAAEPEAEEPEAVVVPEPLADPDSAAAVSPWPNTGCDTVMANATAIAISFFLNIIWFSPWN